MSESETLEQEVETVETNAVEELINQITAGDLTNAEGSFKSIIQDKMADALESQRVATANDIFNTPEGLDDEEIADIADEAIEDMDITDEELEDVTDEEIIAELDDEVENIEEIEETEEETVEETDSEEV